jgi:hypothetical protein
VAAGRLLGEQQLAVEGDLESPTTRRDKRDLLEDALETLDDPGRQTDGSLGVPSDRAVLDGHPHSERVYVLARMSRVRQAHPREPSFREE